MDKKHIFGIFLALIVLAGIGVVLLNQGGSSNFGDSQDVNTSNPAEQNVNTSIPGLKTVRQPAFERRRAYLYSEGRGVLD